MKPGTAHARFTDVTGRLDAITEESLRITRDDDTHVDIDRTMLVAAKPIPPKRVSYSSIADWQAACDATWPAPRTMWLGRWKLRAANGSTRRANSVLVLGEPGVDRDAAIERVEAFYAALNQPAGFSLALPLTQRLDRLLAARGWTQDAATSVYTADIEAVADPSPMTIDNEPSPDWLRFSCGDALNPATATLLGKGPHRGFAEIHVDGDIAAIGRGAVEGDTAVISSVAVAPRHRRHGFGGRVVSGLADWASRQGAQRVCVQVTQDNTAALSLYRRLGFIRHHDYHYRWAPQAE